MSLADNPSLSRLTFLPVGKQEPIPARRRLTPTADVKHQRYSTWQPRTARLTMDGYPTCSQRTGAPYGRRARLSVRAIERTRGATNQVKAVEAPGIRNRPDPDYCLDRRRVLHHQVPTMELAQVPRSWEYEA